MGDRIRRGRISQAFGALLTMTVGCGQPVLSVDDAVLMDGRPVRLLAYLEREPMFGVRDGIENATVEFQVDGIQAGSARTGSNGEAEVRVTLPAPDIDSFEARATVDGRELRQQARIYDWREPRVIVAVDIDETIADTEYDDLLFEKIDTETHPIRGARDALSAMSEHCHVFYLSVRPRFLLERTREWLRKYEFPPGPVITSTRLRDLVKHTRYKRRRLAALREVAPNLLIGIGDNSADAEAYGANRMLTLILQHDEDDEARYRPHVLLFENWRSIAAFFDANREILTDPTRLRKTINDRGMLARPLIPWRKED